MFNGVRYYLLLGANSTLKKLLFIIFTNCKSNHNIKFSDLKIPRGLIGFGEVACCKLFNWQPSRNFYFFTICWCVFTTEKKEPKPKMLKMKERDYLRVEVEAKK